MTAPPKTSPKKQIPSSGQGVVAVRFTCSKKRFWANLFNKYGLPALAFRSGD